MTTATVVVCSKAKFFLRTWTSPNGKPREAWNFSFWVETPTGKFRVQKSGFADRKGAQEGARFEVERIRAECQGMAKQPPTTLALHDVFDEYVAEALAHLKPKSARTEREDVAVLRKEVPDSPLSKLSPAIHERLLAKKRADGVSPFRMRRLGLVLGRIAKFAVRRGYLAKNPLEGCALPKCPDLPPCALTVPEATALFSACEGWLRCAVALALFGGLRLGEVLSLRWERIDTGNGLIRVCSHAGGFSTKSGKSRSVGIHPLLAKELQAQRARVRPDCPWVFPTNRGEGPRKSLRTSFDAAKARAKLGDRNLGFHVLRHSFAVLAALGGCAPVVLQSALGHSSLQVTKRYLRVADGIGVGAVGFLPDLTKGGDAPGRN